MIYSYLLFGDVLLILLLFPCYYHYYLQHLLLAELKKGELKELKKGQLEELKKGQLEECCSYIACTLLSQTQMIWSSHHIYICHRDHQQHWQIKYKLHTHMEFSFTVIIIIVLA